MAACPSGHIHNTRQLNKRRIRKRKPTFPVKSLCDVLHLITATRVSFFHSLFHWIPKMTPSQINLFATPFHINNNNFNNYNDNSRVVATAAAAYVVSVVVAVVKEEEEEEEKSNETKRKIANSTGIKSRRRQNGRHKIRNV